MGGKIEGNLVYGILYSPEESTCARMFLLQNVPVKGSTENWGFISDICETEIPSEITNTIQEKVVMETGYDIEQWKFLGSSRDLSGIAGLGKAYVLAAVLDEVSSKCLETSPVFRYVSLPNMSDGKNISPDSLYIARYFGGVCAVINN